MKYTKEQLRDYNYRLQEFNKWLEKMRQRELEQCKETNYWED